MALFGRRTPPLFPGGTERRFVMSPPPRAFPLMPLLAATLVLLACVEVYTWLGQSNGSLLGRFVSRAFYGFSLHPTWLNEAPAVMAQRREVRAGQVPLRMTDVQIPLTPRPGDLVLGDPAGRTVVTLLNDPMCGACRDALANLLVVAAKPRVRLVVSYWPKDPARATGGLVMALADAGKVQRAFWKALMTAKGDLTEPQLLDMLANAGLNFETQRALLTTRPELGRGLGTLPNRAAGLEPPVVAVNGRVIPAEILPDLLDTFTK